MYVYVYKYINKAVTTVVPSVLDHGTRKCTVNSRKIAWCWLSEVLVSPQSRHFFNKVTKLLIPRSSLTASEPWIATSRVEEKVARFQDEYTNFMEELILNVSVGEICN